MRTIRLFTNNLVLLLVFKIPMIAFVVYLLILSRFSRAINEISFMKYIYGELPDSKFKDGSLWFWDEK